MSCAVGEAGAAELALTHGGAGCSSRLYFYDALDHGFRSTLDAVASINSN